MKVKDLNPLIFNNLTPTLDCEREIDDFYCGDLLSFVMGHVKEANMLLLTIITSMNVIAVASLLEMSAVVFCENTVPNSEVINKAVSENIILFTTKLSSAKALKVIYESLL